MIVSAMTIFLSFKLPFGSFATPEQDFYPSWSGADVFAFPHPFCPIFLKGEGGIKTFGQKAGQEESSSFCYLLFSMDSS